MDLQIRRGETVGIIGRNGSGKSTLLQLLCGTLAPTQGEVEVQGRVAALLALGAGFNPRCTGVEIVALNAAILGLSQEETAVRMDDIFAFADLRRALGRDLAGQGFGIECPANNRPKRNLLIPTLMDLVA